MNFGFWWNFFCILAWNGTGNGERELENKSPKRQGDPVKLVTNSI